VFAESKHDQRCVHVGLKAEVTMDILGQLASAADEARRRIELDPRSRPGATLAVEPLTITGEEALSPRGHDVTLLDRPDTVWDSDAQELAEIGTDQVAWCLAAECLR